MVGSHLERLRKAEIEIIKPLLRPGMKVLELGGGNGYQAHLMSLFGCEVTSIDIATRKSSPKTYYAVQDYDGERIPFTDKSFDMVFSSSVLEHVRDLPTTLSEIHRVLKSNGLAVHVLPNCSWRFWTSIAHYLFVIKYVFGHHQGEDELGMSSLKEKEQSKGMMHLVKRAMFPGPHGNYSNAFSELYYFSKRRWETIFKKNGFDILNIMGNNLFYTGYGLFPRISLHGRQSIANVLGSSCYIYIMRS